MTEPEKILGSGVVIYPVGDLTRSNVIIGIDPLERVITVGFSSEPVREMRLTVTQAHELVQALLANIEKLPPP